jgi:hypothetical protein
MTASSSNKSGYDALADAESTRFQQAAARGKGAWDWCVFHFFSNTTFARSSVGMTRIF